MDNLRVEHQYGETASVLVYSGDEPWNLRRRRGAVRLWALHLGGWLVSQLHHPSDAAVKVAKASALWAKLGRSGFQIGKCQHRGEAEPEVETGPPQCPEINGRSRAEQVVRRLALRLLLHIGWRNRMIAAYLLRWLKKSATTNRGLKGSRRAMIAPSAFEDFARPTVNRWLWQF